MCWHQDTKEVFYLLERFIFPRFLGCHIPMFFSHCTSQSLFICLMPKSYKEPESLSWFPSLFYFHLLLRRVHPVCDFKCQINIPRSSLIPEAIDSTSWCLTAILKTNMTKIALISIFPVPQFSLLQQMVPLSNLGWKLGAILHLCLFLTGKIFSVFISKIYLESNTHQCVCS